MAADYKTKYLEIRAKLIESVDVAFRDGYAQGMEEGEKQAQEMAEQEQMMMEQEAMAAEGGAPGMEGGAPPGMEPGESPPEEMPMEEEGMPEEGGGSELDQAMGELEGMVSKGEKPKVTDLRKAIEKVASIRKTQISKANTRQKKIASAQSQFVSSMIKSWDKSSKDVTEDLEETIKAHGFKVE